MNKIKELEQRYAQWKEDEKQRQMVRANVLFLRMHRIIAFEVFLQNEMRDFKNSVMIELNEEKSALEQV